MTATRIKPARAEHLLARLGVAACMIGILPVTGGLQAADLIRPVTPAKSPPREGRVETNRIDPLVSVRIQGAWDGRVLAGWPLIIHAALRHPRASQAPGTVSPIALPGGKMLLGAFRLEVSGGGKKLSWPFHAPEAPAEPMTLDARTGVDAFWWLTAEETGAIEPGSYTLAACLDTTGVEAPGVWKGRARSDTISLVVERENRPLSPAEATAKELMIARVENFQGRSTEAAARIDAVLAREPRNIEALVGAAMLAEEGGRIPEAIGFYERALRETTAYAPGGDPPSVLIREIRRLRALLGGQNR